MDLNDPRRRLQVLNNSNPSLRVSVAKPSQPKVAIAQPQQQRIVVPQNPNPAQRSVPNVPNNRFKAIDLDEGKNKTIFGWNAAALLPKSLEKTYGVNTKDVDFGSADEFLKYFDTRDDEFRRAYVSKMQKDSQNDPVAARTLKLLQDKGRFKGSFSDFVEGSNERFLGGIGRGLLRGTDFVLPGKNTFGLEGLADDQDASKKGTRQFTSAGKAGEVAGTAQKTVFDIASLVAGGTAAETAASKVSSFSNLVNKLQQGGKISRTAGKALSLLPGSLGGSTMDVLQTAGRGDEQNVAKSFGVGTAIDLGIPVLGKGLKKGFNLFKGKGSKSFSFVDDLIGESDPANIKRVLGDIDEDMATFLAQETNPNTVKQVLAEMSVDPNIKLTDDVRQRLADEGITAVREGESPYGTHYNTGDKSITISDPKYTDPQYVYQELGHHIYSTKLTPEEKAMFAGIKGRAYNEAVGRAGYTEDDLVSEDFADFMRLALNGRLDAVPEGVRPVIQKYARIAAQEAQSAGIALPNPKSTDMVAQKPTVNTKVDQSLVDDGLVSGKIFNAKLNDLKLGTDTVGDIDINQVSKYIDEISSGKPIEPVIVQRGPNGELLVQDGKHRLEALKALGIEDVPYTEKVVKQADEVQQAVTDAAPANSGVVDAPLNQVDNTVDSVDNLGGDATQTVAPVVNQNADEAAQRFTEFEPEVQAQLNKIMDELPNAQKSYDDVAKVRGKERAGRIQAGNAAYEAAGGGEAGVRAKLGALKGEYSKSGFNPVQADEATQQSILDTIEKSNLRDFEKLNTQNAMRKIWGTNDAKPTTSDINYIRKFFGDDLADQVEQAVEEAGDKGWRNVLSNIAGIPRAAMSTLDFSMGGRQGAPVMVRNLGEWANANKESIKYATSNEFFEKAMKDIQSDDAYELMADKMGVRFPAIGKEAMEGDFISSDYIEKIPLYGSKGVAGSRRAYDGGLTKLRYNIAKKWIDESGGVDAFMKRFNEKEIKDIGEVINTFTGSGGKKGGMLDQHMKTLSNTLFAPRFWAANLNRLNPVFYARLSPVARKEALKYQSSFYALAGSVLAMASAAGADVVWDPRSADFAKIKIGNTRYDVLGGQQQNIRLAAQLATGEKIDSTTGELRDLGEGFTNTRKGIIADTFEGKANPLLGFGMKMLDIDSNGENKYGEHVNPFLEAAKLGIPLNFQGIAETTKDRGNLAVGTGMNLPGFFGVGVQTYGPVASKDRASDGKFKGKITDDMVLDPSGQPMLDEKGRVIKAKFDDAMSDMERQAALTSKREEAYRAKAKTLLSKDDLGIYRMGQADRDALTPEQQKKYDQVKKWVEDYGMAQDTPEGANSDVAKTFYKKYNSMTKADQENWLKESPDENAKTVASLLNKERSKGLSEFKPSNELTKAYAEFEKDINSHPEYTEFDLRKKAREFQKHAYKLNYSTNQRDTYSANVGDIRYMINEKMLSKEDLDAAIKMDDEMYNAGLISDLKFSKKFRKEYGYGLPSGGGVNKNLASGGSGSGDETPRTYIANLLPSFKSSQGGEKPQFSSKRRTAGISFKNVSTPKSGSGKKISINL